MSDFMFVLESHLNTGQNRVVAEMQGIATDAGMGIWLTGGAMRDMLRGAQIRDLDFTVERDAQKVAKSLAAKLGGQILQEDTHKRWTELTVLDDIRLSVSNARTEKYAKPGGKPTIAPATIHEDLHRRDFTINAIGLSLNRGSRGLLVDPTNGQADLLNRELRATNPYIYYDDPGRLFRLIRFRHALGFQPTPRAQLQFENAILEHVQKTVPANQIAREILAMALDPGLAPMLEELDSHGLLASISKVLTGPALNIAGLDRFEKLFQSVMPPGTTGGTLAFLLTLVETLSAKDRAEALVAFELSSADAAELKKLDAKAKALDAELKSPRMSRHSNIWEVLHDASVNVVMTVLMHSTTRAVHDRIRAWFEKYQPLAEEITDDEVAATGAKPGTPKWDKARASLIAAKLNFKPKKEEPEEVPQI
jgi:tRNA nucleotidyltransferase (CCA-adding enzyme)